MSGTMGPQSLLEKQFREFINNCLKRDTTLVKPTFFNKLNKSLETGSFKTIEVKKTDLKKPTIVKVLKKGQLTDVCTNCIYRGVDWIYTFVEFAAAYDLKVWYFWFMGLIFQDNFNFYFNLYWYSMLLLSNYQLYFSTFLDFFIKQSVVLLPYKTDWFNSFLLSSDSVSSLYYCPELLYAYSHTSVSKNSSFVLFRFVVNNLNNSENILTAVMFFPQFLFSMVLVGLLFMLYFNYYTTSTREDSLIDQDYLILNTTLDAEEEIGSVDDILFGFLIFFFTFGWFFYFNVWSVFTFLPELMVVFWFFPFIYVIILLIPTSLLFDFGIYFASYLRGVGTTSSFLFEMMYDYIAIFAFFIRLLVQGVRLLLMLFVFASLHDLIIYWQWTTKWFLGYEYLWEDSLETNPSVESFSYYFFSVAPLQLLYWVYELFHTFFVVIAQFFAFFGMIFWLFFFLYTFFIFEPQEMYLSAKRSLHVEKKNFHNEVKSLNL